MSINVVQLVLGALTPALVEKLAGVLGESPAATQKGLGPVVSAVLGSLLKKGADAEGAGAILDVLRSNNIGGGLLDTVGDMFGGAEASQKLAATGGPILTRLLGDKMGAMAGLIGGFAGLKNASAHQLLSMIAPLVLGGVAKAAPAGGFTPQGLISTLASQKEHIAAVAPPGLGPLLGLAGLDRGLTAAAPQQTETKQRNILPWVLGAAGVAALAFIGPRMCAPAPTLKAPAVEAPTLPDLTKIELPGGVTLDLRPGSIGDQLAGFLKTSDPAPKTFVFDNLNFETGGTTLTAESVSTVDAIAKILQAYPKAQVKLDGFTDNTGGAAANLRISRDRAIAVAALLAERGVERGRIATEGFGPAKPIATNDTDEGRAQNRRIELTVTQK